jgi:hypothetical protein
MSPSKSGFMAIEHSQFTSILVRGFGYDQSENDGLRPRGVHHLGYLGRRG